MPATDLGPGFRPPRWYGSAGNKDDRFDAFVLADTLRTDRARLRPLVPDSPQPVALRQTCRARGSAIGGLTVGAGYLILAVSKD